MNQFSELLHPALQCRFQVLYEGKHLSVEQSQAMSMSTMSAVTDLNTKTVEIVIQQPKVLSVFAGVRNFIAAPNNLVIQFRNEDDTVGNGIRFMGMKIVDHKFALDYKYNKPAKHILTISFNKCEAV